MRITLIKYISKEIWSVFLTCLLVFIFIVLASQMLNMTELMVNYGAGFSDLFNLTLCQLPRVILFAMPAACLMAVLLSFIRMASDNEIIALRSSGISLYQLMPSVVLFSLICFLFAGFLTMFWSPYGYRTFESVFLKIMKTSVESQIKEGVFMETKDFVFYVNSYSPKDKIMKDVFVVDKRKKREITVVAKKARFISDNGGLNILFTDSKVFTEGKDGETIVAEHPDVSNYPIGINSILESSENNKRDPDGMYIEELLELINNSNEGTKSKNTAKLRVYEMFSLPFSILFIGMAGAPLGARIRAHGRTKGIIISLLLFLSYYIILTSVRYICENGIVDPAVGVWLPVLFLLIMCIYLIAGYTGSLSFIINKVRPTGIPRKG